MIQLLTYAAFAYIVAFGIVSIALSAAHAVEVWKRPDRPYNEISQRQKDDTKRAIMWPLFLWRPW